MFLKSLCVSIKSSKYFQAVLFKKPNQTKKPTNNHTMKTVILKIDHHSILWTGKLKSKKNKCFIGTPPRKNHQRSVKTHSILMEFALVCSSTWSIFQFPSDLELGWPHSFILNLLSKCPKMINDRFVFLLDLHIVFILQLCCHETLTALV